MLGDVTLTLGEAFGVALTGLTVVFLALISLLIAIMIISKVVGGIQGKQEPNQSAAPVKAAPQKKVVDNSMDPALLAAIIGAISMEERSRVESFRIVSINEKK
ncbi:MAG: OadG family protein [Peptoniphilus sp.]|uniref:OadG family protein n=1 Tax=Peptoniphilus sp. TaxID=1971214 RepID=UPI0025FA68C0|nr:OadG family protein [Peptoniphilus sp.]MCI5643539.1 OadG family protein [Peptoniphilus sp.]MDD7353056.1 OadG family protein [Peptoniphilaceae bacterium]MDY3902221.1 OadG family protein [Peptoniphilus sp.]